MSIALALAAATSPGLVWSTPFAGLPGCPSWALLAPGTGEWLATPEGIAALAWARERVEVLAQLEHLPTDQRQAELRAWELERAAREISDPAARLLHASETLGVLHRSIRACRTYGPDGQVEDEAAVCAWLDGQPGWPAPAPAVPLDLRRMSVPLLLHLRVSLMQAALGALERAVSLPAAWATGGAEGAGQPGAPVQPATGDVHPS